METNKQKKSVWLRIGALALCSAMCMNVLASCQPAKPAPTPGTTTKKYDNETTAVNFSTGELDGVFNPFFSTSAYDSEITGVTQISMLSADKNGKLTYGRDEEVMTLDYTETMYDAEGNETETGSSLGTTKYEFLIKNGVKDSKGNPITIKDVLFNIYVYLDPVYNGSSTMYSTKIQGLSAYRTGRADATDKDNAGLDTTASNNAYATMQNIELYANWRAYPDNSSYAAGGNFEKADQEKFDEYINYLYGLFDDMLVTDWNETSNSMVSANENYVLVDAEDYEGNKVNPKTYDISETWELFCINEGLCQYVKLGDSYKTDDETPRYYILIDEGIQIDVADAPDQAKEICFDAMKKEYKNYSKVAELMSGFSISSDFHSYLKDIELGKLLANDTVKSISGITTRKTNSFNGVEYASEHDVLTIVIDGIDPKAKWNFAFSVAPMAYYASEEEIKAFDGVEHFGIKKGDATYRDTVLKDKDRMGLPVGGGAYMASTEQGGEASKGTEFKKNNVVYYQRNPYFYTIGIDSPTATAADYNASAADSAKAAYDGENAIHNANIKYIRYQVVSSATVLDSMIEGSIDYSGDISAKQENINSIGNQAHLSYALQSTNGYGYIGINPKYVQDIEVRRLIMYAIDREYITDNYYTNGLGEIIERPMSTNSWAYPEGATEYYTQDWFINHYKKDLGKTLSKTNDRKTFVENALKALGYTKKGGDDFYSKTLSDSKRTNSKLDYTFTIAGETKDHPAYGVFQDVATLLSGVMKITVKTDARALSKLSNGQLAVWAAAWSSTVDPDMYQVYHKNSQATSVNNWGYSTILPDTTGLYRVEKGIIDNLSTLIDDGRSVLDDATRATYYKEALDLVMSLAVELPTYQRTNLLVYNSSKIDPASLNTEITAYEGLISNIWKLNLR